MKYARLGNSDLTVSRICMGCMGFGDAQNGQHSWTIDELHSAAPSGSWCGGQRQLSAANGSPV